MAIGIHSDGILLVLEQASTQYHSTSWVLLTSEHVVRGCMSSLPKPTIVGIPDPVVGSETFWFDVMWGLKLRLSIIDLQD